IQRIDNGTSGGGAWGANSTASNNGAEPAVSAINNGFQTAAKQQRVAVTGGWAFNSQWDERPAARHRNALLLGCRLEAVVDRGHRRLCAVVRRRRVRTPCAAARGPVVDTLD